MVMLQWMLFVQQNVLVRRKSVPYIEEGCRYDSGFPIEIEGAVAEGIEMQTLKAPASLDVDENHHIKGIYVTPQMISAINNGRASINDR